MEINKWVQDIHNLAVEKGWWDGERDDAALAALIHSEWSEALEEDRAGRPLLWYGCIAPNEAVCEWGDNVLCKFDGNCHMKEPKPEGVGVELIDGVIRILDWVGGMGARFSPKDEAYLSQISGKRFGETTLPNCVNTLHGLTCDIYAACGESTVAFLESALCAVVQVFDYILVAGGDPVQIMEVKHAYNKTRPARHGKLY